MVIMIKENIMELTMLKTNTTIPAMSYAPDQKVTNNNLRWLESLAKSYKPCWLEDLGETALMDRTDTKFVLPLKLGLQILSEMQPHYQMLEIDGQRLQPYNTVYFDTPDYFFYREQLRSRDERYKLRIRTYLVNDLSFLEVKQRTNKGRTVKERIELNDFWSILDPDAVGWAVKRLPAAAWPLEPVLNNQFYRLLLINPDQAERITLDFDLQFSDQTNQVDSGSLVVAEVKRKSRHEESVFINWLRAVHQRQTSFSKYCLGLALLKPELKHNNMKPNLMKLQKMQELRCA